MFNILLVMLLLLLKCEHVRLCVCAFYICILLLVAYEIVLVMRIHGERGVVDVFLRFPGLLKLPSHCEMYVCVCARMNVT